MSDDLVLLNGRVMPAQEARISPRDRGFLYGDGFFETMRVVAGTPSLLDSHLERLNASCRHAGWGRDLDAGAIAAGIRELLERSGLADGYLRITVSRGLHSRGLTDLAAEQPTIFADCREADLAPLDDAPPLTLKKSPYVKSARSPVIRHKSVSYQFNVLALAEARRQGADEVFFLNAEGYLTEGAITNLFFVRQKAVFTPSVECGLLPGIARRVVAELCDEEGIPLSEGHYGERDLERAGEVFCTNSLRGVVPVKAIVDYPDARLAPGPLTGRLQKLYAQRIHAECGRDD